MVSVYIANTKTLEGDHLSSSYLKYDMLMGAKKPACTVSSKSKFW